MWYLGDPSPASGPRKFIFVLLVAVLSIFAWTITYRATFQDIYWADALDYAQMGRQLYRNQGFSSFQSYPYVLGWLSAHGKSTDIPWPNLHRFPLPILLNALVFLVTGVSDFSCLLSGLVFHVGTAVLVFILGNRLYGPLVGLLASILSLTSLTQLSLSVSGMTEPGAAFFVVAIALGYDYVARKSLRLNIAPLLLGFLAGIAFLLRYDLLLYCSAIGILLFARYRLAAMRSVILVAMGAAFVASPWLIYHLMRFGEPLICLNTHRMVLHGIVPGEMFCSITQYDIGRMILNNLDKLLTKPDMLWVFTNWRIVFGEEFIWLAPAFLFSGFVLRSHHTRHLWLFLLVGFFIRHLPFGLMYAYWRYYVFFAPLVLVITIGAGVVVLRRLPRPLHLLIPLAVFLLVGWYSWPVAKNISTYRTKDHDLHEVCDAIQSNVAPNSAVASHLSARISWYCEHPSILFRGDISQLSEIDKNYVKIGAIFLGDYKALNFEQRLNASSFGRNFDLSPASRENLKLWLRNP